MKLRQRVSELLHTYTHTHPSMVLHYKLTMQLTSKPARMMEAEKRKQTTNNFILFDQKKAKKQILNISVGEFDLWFVISKLILFSFFHFYTFYKLQSSWFQAWQEFPFINIQLEIITNSYVEAGGVFKL